MVIASGRLPVRRQCQLFPRLRSVSDKAGGWGFFMYVLAIAHVKYELLVIYNFLLS